MKKRKLFLPNGILSLIFLPIICLIFINQNSHFINERILPVYFWDIKNPPVFEEEFNNYIKNKKYEHFYLTNCDDKNKEVFSLASKSIQKLLLSKDTINGVHLFVPNNAKFKTFIDGINLCNTLKVKVFIPNNNDIWIINPKPEKKETLSSPSTICMVIIDPIQKYEKTEKEIYLERKEKIDYFIRTSKTYIYPILIFLIMVIINIVKIRNLSISK